MVDFLKKNAMLSIISSVLFLVLGIIVVLYPDAIMTFISYVLGIAFILIGMIKMVSCFTNKDHRNGYHLELIFGLIVIGAGIFVITCGNTIGALFRIIVGIWIVYNGMISFMTSFQLKRIGLRIWPLLLMMSIIMIIAGGYVIVNSGALIISIGAIMIIYAIMDLIESIFFYSNLSRL